MQATVRGREAPRSEVDSGLLDGTPAIGDPEAARPGEVLVTQEVVDASGVAGATFAEIGPVELKGMSGAVRLHAAHRA